jgi:hypothetical protein
MKLLMGVGDLGKSMVIISFRGARAIRGVWMETVHAYAHRTCVARPAAFARSRPCLRSRTLCALSTSFPKTAAYIDKYAADCYDWSTYQLRSYFRVHLFHFIVSPIIGGLLMYLKLDQSNIPESADGTRQRIYFIDFWFSAMAAMSGGSLMPYDVSRLDRFCEAVLYVLMFVGGITMMCVPPALNRMYIFRRKLRPGLLHAIALSRELQELARETGVEGADALSDDIQEFETMLVDYGLKDEAQEVIAAIAFTYTACWHIIGGGLIYVALRVGRPVLEYTSRGITDAWFSIFMVRVVTAAAQLLLLRAGWRAGARRAR